MDAKTKKEIIERLKFQGTERPCCFGLLTTDEQEVMREANEARKLLYYSDVKNWLVTLICEWKLGNRDIFKISPDYNPPSESEIVKCEVNGKAINELHFKYYHKEQSIITYLDTALRLPNFAGAKYANGDILAEVRRKLPDGTMEWPKWVLLRKEI